MRLTERFGTVSPSVRSRWAAGSVVERWTLCPPRASSRAILVAMVVLPTPPLPIVRITPWPVRVISGMSVFERRRQRVELLLRDGRHRVPARERRVVQHAEARGRR